MDLNFTPQEETFRGEVRAFFKKPKGAGYTLEKEVILTSTDGWFRPSDVCVGPAAGVAAEAMVALTIARLVIDKFGGDSLRELQRNYNGYCEQIRRF